MTFSLSIAHTPWIPARVESLKMMNGSLVGSPPGTRMWLHTRDFRGRRWYDIKHEWALDCWRWHLRAGADHCIMMSDDLYIMPGFWPCAEAMVRQVSMSPIGMMTNHPRATTLLSQGVHWYRSRSWLVGPCILMPRTLLQHFVNWYEEWYPNLPDGEAYGQKGFFHDDSSINEFVHRAGGYSWHPIPAPIEHRLDIGRTHDDQAFPAEAAESVSWRRNSLGEVSEYMQQDYWWRTDAPFLNVTTEEKRMGIT
jgi:hypothetical protein